MTMDALPRRLALVHHGEPSRERRLRSAGTIEPRLSPEGRRQSLTAVGRLAYSRWSWIAASAEAASEETARIVAVEFPHAPLMDLAEGEAGNAGRGSALVASLLLRNPDDGVIVSSEGLLRTIITDLCDAEPPRLEYGALVILREASRGWEISHGSSFGIHAELSGQPSPRAASAAPRPQRNGETVGSAVIQKRHG